MIGIVEADADELADAGNARAVTRTGRGEGERRRIDGGDLCQASIGEGIAGDVVDHTGEVADLAIGIDEAGFFSARRAEAEQFHFVFLNKGGEAVQHRRVMVLGARP